MVELIAIHVEPGSEELGRASLDERVMAAMAAGAAASLLCQPRLRRMPTRTRRCRSASMKTDLAALHRRSHDRSPRAPTARGVLEIGTGLGYQSAILAELAGQVWSAEIIEEFRQAGPRPAAGPGLY